jgi:hypothetical protein
MNYLEKFNQTFVEFVDDLCIAYPNDGEFQMCKMVLGTTLAMNERLVHKFFITKIIPAFEQKILARDDEFFQNKDYSQYSAKIAGAADLIAKIKNMWGDMLPENKEAIWRYLRVLIALAKRVPT